MNVVSITASPEFPVVELEHFRIENIYSRGSRCSLRRVTTQINCAYASAAGVCSRIRQSTFKMKLLYCS